MAIRNKYKVGLIQMAMGSDIDANLTKAVDFVREAAGLGAKIICLPEMFRSQYFCQKEDADLFDLAEPINGPSVEALSKIADESSATIIAPIFEQRALGLYHNSLVLIKPGEPIAGVYRKMHIPDDPGFYEKFYFTPGDAEGTLRGFQPVQTRLGKLGVLVCWDQWYPEAARLMALAGADMLIYPTAIGWNPEDDVDEQNRQRDAWVTIQRSHAIANGIPVLVANRTGFELSPGGSGEGIEFWGTSFIAGPQGEFLLMADAESEGAFCAEIDLERSENIRRIWPYLRDRRIDAYDNLTKRWLADRQFS